MLDQNKTVIKYIDFGLSKEIDRGLKSNVGTPMYRAPEIFKAKDHTTYTKKADIW